MRLPFPTRIPIQKTLVFAAAVFVAQLLQRTDPVFAGLFFIYIMTSVFAFNAAGGFSRASGAYVFWFALFTCILGGLWKIVLNEPGDSNLVSPTVTLATYVVSMMCIFAALQISHRFTRKTRGLSVLVHADRINLGHAALGCFIANQSVSWANEYLPHGNGSLVSILNQEDFFLPVCILLGTIHTIRTTGGRRSISLLTFAAMSLIFVFGGLVGYSKLGMFMPVVCWGVAASSQRYRLRKWQIVVLLAFAVYSVEILTPLSQVGRAIVPENAGAWDRLMLSVDLLSHPTALRKQYLDAVGTPNQGGQGPAFAAGYFDTPQGLLDRLNMIRADDRLVTYTLQGHTVGKTRVVYYFLNWFPHFILPNKEALFPPGVVNAGNFYAHQIGGLLSPDDFYTGISFSPSAEAFHMDEWEGIVVVGGFVWTLLFIVVDFVCGDVRESPIGLFAVVAFAHVAPESLIGNLVYFIFFGDIGIVMAIFFCTYFAPILGQLLSGPQEPRLARLENLPMSAADA
ncbi:MAG TPA: hypothetical protein VFA99_10965 [Acidobacteriaceae bacterium]|nr:hypothetical protein [Acidobacteriaceae bacterium]